ncbi:MAG: sulfotransferase [Gammaproteobacteria bacterium]|nr:sulfotransferase [Gammaproteobacteria bacterium]MCP5195304.1 sulfotransferase [Gammaproteobacteria bacterium]
MNTDQPLFILCPGRSFSSVVCMAIGQHPQLYGLPEIYLGIVDTLNEWFALAKKPGRKHMHQGLLRVIAQLHHSAQTEEAVLEARAWLQQRCEWSTTKLYHYLADRIAPRQLVDKSPTMGKQQNLERLHAVFPNAYFLHLTRHPRSTGNSFFRVKSAKAALKGYPDPDRLAAMIEKHWVQIHQQILQFTDHLPEGQAMRLQGEDLLETPDRYFRQIAEWLNLRTDSAAIGAMMHPEHSPYAHIGPSNAPHGNNRGFLEQPELKVGRPSFVSLTGPMEWSREGQDFAPATLRLARQLGYQ